MSISAPSNTIGGTAAGERNVISGNASHGVQISGGSASGNTVLGNYVGTNGSGGGQIANGGDGVVIDSGATGNTIGGTTTGHRNVISGNNYGIEVLGATTFGNVIQGNYIGTNAAGTAAIANVENAIHMTAPGNTVGGVTSSPGTAPGNVLSGNLQAGISVYTDDADGNAIYGNLIGTDATGTADLGNGDIGVYILAGADGTLVGSSTAGTRNVISGNNTRGVGIFDSGTTGNVVAGNYIGTNISGTALTAGTQSNGVAVANGGASGNTIGGTTAAARNVIAGNTGDGIKLGESSSADSNTVQGNYVGVATDGSALGNGLYGIIVDVSSNSNVIGGIAAGAGNTIGNNGKDGVFVGDGTGNSIRGNSIYDNAQLGIDLFKFIDIPPGVTDNDSGDLDGGANELMNFPVISSATYNNATRILTVTGTLDTISPDDDFVDVYATNVVDASLNGEGRQWLGQADPNGAGAWTMTSTGVPVYGYVSATATDSSGNTSEFSVTFDADVDGDGFPTSGDRCPTTFNPLQLDHDGDYVGDACDSVVRNRYTVTQSSLVTEFTNPTGGPLASETRAIHPWDYEPGGTIDVGAITGTIDVAYNVRSTTGVCDIGLSFTGITSYNASIDNSGGNLTTTPLADSDGDTILDGVEKYPAFLNTVLDQERRTGVNEDGDGLTDEDPTGGGDNDGDTKIDEDGVGTPRTLHSRSFGVWGGTLLVNTLVFEEQANGRYVLQTIFGDPTAAPSPGSLPTCAPSEFRGTTYSTSMTNTVATPNVPGGDTIINTPSTGTKVFRLEVINPPDTDGDGLSNYDDNCRLVTNVDQADSDADSIGNACEPGSGPCSATAAADCDGDGQLNMQDNCPLVSNSTQSESEVRTPRDFGITIVGEKIGDACDPNPTLVDNGAEVALPQYADPVCVTGGGVVDADADGWCAANDPNDSDPALTPEDDGLALPAGTLSRGICANGVDDDGDTLVDSLDAACADADGDGVPDNVDNCDAAADPLQLNSDGDAQGDACETNTIAALDLISGSNAANSELRNRLVEVAPDRLHKADGIINFIDPDFIVASSGGVGGIDDGAIRGALSSQITVGMDTGPGTTEHSIKACNDVFTVNFTLLDASITPSDSIVPSAGFANLLADTVVVNGLADGVDKYPSFLTRLPALSARTNNDADLATDEDPIDYVDNDLDGSVDEDPYDHVTPLARMFGSVNFQGANRILNVLVYDTSALPQIPAVKGYSVWFIFDNPTSSPPNGNEAAVCSHQDHRLFQYGVSLDNSATVANEGGDKLITNDSAAVTERFSTQVTTLPDLDGDGIENVLDACAFQADNDHDGTPDQSDATPWNPRLLAPTGDPDLDGLATACDRAEDLAPASGECADAVDSDYDGKVNDGCPAVGAAESGANCDNAVDNDGDTKVNDGCPALGDPNVPSPPGSPYDADGDDVGDQEDNCDYVVNADQRDRDFDAIGDVCDPAPTVTGGGGQTFENGTPQCTSGTDEDQDGYCVDVDPRDDLNPETGGSADAGLWVPEVPAYGPNICVDGDDNDHDTLYDTFDPGCGDVDVDGVPNDSDNCPGIPPATAAFNYNPLQEDSDGDGSTNVGQQPYARSGATAIGDPIASQPYARSDIEDWGGDACDPDDDDDGLNDGWECNSADNDNDGLVNDGCMRAGLFSESGAACLNNFDEADEDPGPGMADDDKQVNDGCPASGPPEVDCRKDNDCDDDVFDDVAEWTYSVLNPNIVGTACLNMHTAAPTSGADSLQGDKDSDKLFNYGEVITTGTNPCSDNRGTGSFDLDDPLKPGDAARCATWGCDGDGYSWAIEKYLDDAGLPLSVTAEDTIVGTDPLLRCGVGAVPTPSDAWPSDFVSGSVPNSTDKVNVLDITSFLAPTRRLDTKFGQTNYSRRWDLVPGNATGTNWIVVQDLTALIAGTSGSPPMLPFSGTRAFQRPVVHNGASHSLTWNAVGEGVGRQPTPSFLFRIDA